MLRVSMIFVALFGMASSMPATAASVTKAQCKTYVKQMKGWKAGKPLPNSPNAAQVRLGLNLCLIEGTLKPRDVGNLLD